MNKFLLLGFFLILGLSSTPLLVKEDSDNKERKLGSSLFQLHDHKKTEEIFKLEKQIDEAQELIEQNRKDSDQLKDMKVKVEALFERISKVYTNVVGKVDFAKSRLLSMGYSL